MLLPAPIAKVLLGDHAETMQAVLAVSLTLLLAS